ncbi:unnamed protein product [Arabidopsis thaliana]|uniref:(thale cress) hypothetical protein n=1 Tax=Arabidopsis thaliana TaxID=3702 RepID=A0A7G2ERW0_ARATH|nr:unnamed protein product [Arabidopsis thaliana]
MWNYGLYAYDTVWLLAYAIDDFESILQDHWLLNLNNGRHLRSGVPNRSEEVVSVKSNGMISGFCVDVFIAALNLLPYAVPFELLAFGSGHDNPSNSELVRLIRTGVST